MICQKSIDGVRPRQRSFELSKQEHGISRVADVNCSASNAHASANNRLSHHSAAGLLIYNQTASQDPANAILLLIIMLYARSSKDISLPETTAAQSLAGPVQSQNDPLN